MYASVSFPVGLFPPQSFEYILPAALALKAPPGSWVQCQFGRRRIWGLIESLNSDPLFQGSHHQILQSACAPPELCSWLLNLCQFLAGHYGTSAGLAAKTVLSPLHCLAIANGPSPAAASWRQSTATHPIALNADQEQGLAKLHEYSGQNQPSYLWGPTGSGKSFVLLAFIRDLLRRNLSSIYLVPEISLTPQFLELFEKNLPSGTRFALWSSSVGAAKKKALIQDIAAGRVQVVIGTRSAVFLPLKNLGAIIVDEEQDPSFKQETPAPCYHARDVALWRCREERLALVLASATPSLECYQAWREGSMVAVRLERRWAQSLPPEVKILRNLPDNANQEELLAKIRCTVDGGHHAVIYHNRRGFSRSLECRICRKSVRCRHCDLPLTLHKEQENGTNLLRCHHCGIRRKIPSECPSCSAPAQNLMPLGFGTQQLAEQFEKALGRTVARLDRDTSKNSNMIYSDFKSGQAKVLVGTKLVAKGWHFPQVTLAAVMNADTELTMPDFRACERAFQTLFQVAGRSGRGADPGEVWVWTSSPDHYIFESLRLNDQTLFYEQELELRRRMSLPPFTRMLLVELRGQKREFVEQAARGLLELWQTQAPQNDIEAMGGVPSYFQKIRKIWRFQVVLRAGSPSAPFPWKEIAAALKLSHAPGVKARLHPDPQNLF